MTIERRYPPASDSPPGFGIDSVADRRARIQREQEELAAARQRELAAQASAFTEPQERIRIWERLHAVPLPRSANHKLVRVIAVQTDLTIQQVHLEQERRAASAT